MRDRLPPAQETPTTQGLQAQNWYEKHQPCLLAYPQDRHFLDPISSQPNPRPKFSFNKPGISI